jgi:hypothetical protein
MRIPVNVPEAVMKEDLASYVLMQWDESKRKEFTFTLSREESINGKGEWDAMLAQETGIQMGLFLVAKKFGIEIPK